MGLIFIEMKKWNGKKVLVTGGTGLVGGHLVRALMNEGAHVVVTYRDMDPASYFMREKLNENVVMALCDVTDATRMFDVVTHYEIETVFHLAAQALVPQAFLNPMQTFTTNVNGTLNVLEAARRAGHVNAVVVASSDKAYGKCDGEYRETDPLRGDHPYDTSKSATDLLATTYAATYDLPVTVTRFGNIYGEGDLNFNRLIPGLIQAIRQGRPFEIRSDGTYTRDYVYVKDVVDGYLMLAEKIDRAKGQAYNLTSHEHLSVLEVIETLERTLGIRVEKKILNIARHEIPHQTLNDDKIRQKIGWASRFTLEQTLPQIYQWYA